MRGKSVWRVMGAAAALALAPAAFAGCGGDDADGGGGATGGGGVQGTVSNGVITLPVSIESMAPQPFLVDTGSPLVLVDPTRYPGFAVDSGLGVLRSLRVGDLDLMNVEFVAASPCGATQMMMMCRGSSPAGLLGGDALVGGALTIDYRAERVAFGGPFTPPAGVGAPVTAPFTLRGGGTATSPNLTAPVTIPASRIVLDVEIEGTAVLMVLDTGSSAVVLQPALYDSLVADGREQSTIQVSTVRGTESEPSTALRAVAVAGASQSGVQAIRSPLDLSALEQEVGRSIQGLLGGAYLEHYLTTIDYPALQLTLRAY